MAASRRGKVGEGFVPEAKRGTLRKYVKCRGGEGVCEKLAYLLVTSFFSFFLLLCVICLWVQKALCSAGYEEKKTYKQSNDPLHLFMGKIKHPESIEKVPPA